MSTDSRADPTRSASTFQLDEAVLLLERTPRVLRELLAGLPDEWTRANEGPDTWSAYDVVGHLIHGEKTDWIPRAKRVLEHGEAVAFEPFDRTAQLRQDRSRPLEALLDEFEQLRRESLAALASLELGQADLQRRGRHPDFGLVTLRELIATWVAHDLGHLAQVARVLAKRHATDVGPWRAYLPVLGDRSR